MLAHETVCTLDSKYQGIPGDQQQICNGSDYVVSDTGSIFVFFMR